MAVALGFFLSLSMGEWIALVLCIALVLVAELLNTAIEYLCDALHPDLHPEIGRAKDVAAGAVLIAALAAMTVGAILFLPKLWDLFTK
jgi:diacylglycerol kinase